MILNRKQPQEEELEEELEDLPQDPYNDDDDYYDDDLGGDSELTPMEKHSDLLKELTNFSPYLKDCFNNWLGITWNEETKTFRRNPSLLPIMNEVGAAWCIGVLKTYARSNNIITDIGRREYDNIMGDIIDDLWLNIGCRDDFGIKHEGDILRVCNELEHAASLALMGAGDGKYNKMLSTTISRTEHLTQQNNPNNPNNIQPINNSFSNKVKGLITGQ